MTTLADTPLEHSTIGGVTLAYRDVGHGPPVLLLHGFPFDHTLWRDQVATVTEEHRLILPDLRGHGESDAPPPPYPMNDFADDIRGLLDRLDLDQVVLGGMSMGGYVALAFADRYPERLAGLILMATRADADTEAVRQVRMESAARVQEGGVEAIADGLYERILGGREVADDIRHTLRGWIHGTSIEGIAGSLVGMAARPDLTTLLPRITCPVLVVAGSEDDIAPPDCARTMATGVPDGVLTVIPAAGHLLPLERPAELNAALRPFLAGSRS